jgi:hypothetical protein
MVGGEGRVRGSHSRQSTTARGRAARAVGLRDTLLAFLGTVALGHSQAPWRHGSNDMRRSHIAITARSDGLSAGSRSEGSQGGRGWGYRQSR